MNARPEHRARIWTGLAGALLIVVSMLLTIAPAHAAPRSHAAISSVTLALNNAQHFIYGGSPAPQFTVTVVLTAPPTVNYYWQAYVLFDTQQIFGSVDGKGTGPTTVPGGVRLTFFVDTTGTAIPAGNRTATARFTDPSSNTTAFSAPLSLTIDRATPSLGCSGGPYGELFGVGQTMQISMSFFGGNSNAAVDWQNATYDITFVGPSTVKISGLVPDSQDTVTVHAPTQIGYYQLDCVFNGTTLFTPATVAGNINAILVSEKQHLGSVQLFSNPTTLTAYQRADVYVVFHAAPGLPTPTGRFGLAFGSAYTSMMTMGPNGDLLVHLGTLPSLMEASQITLNYDGDPYYDVALLHFPLTNPPLPGSGSGVGGPTAGKAQATATGVPTQTPVATVTAGRDGAGTLSAPIPPRTGLVGVGGALFRGQ